MLETLDGMSASMSEVSPTTIEIGLSLASAEGVKAPNTEVERGPSVPICTPLTQTTEFFLWPAAERSG